MIGHLISKMRKGDPYWMHAEAQTARAHAKRVAEYEQSGQVGAWGQWQTFIDQWHVDSPEREYLVFEFGLELDTFDERGLDYDPSMADIW